MTTWIRLYIPLADELIAILPDAGSQVRTAIEEYLTSYSEALGSFEFDESAVIIEVISDYRDAEMIKEIVLESLVNTLPDDCSFEFDAEIDLEYELDEDT